MSSTSSGCATESRRSCSPTSSGSSGRAPPTDSPAPPLGRAGRRSLQRILERLLDLVRQRGLADRAPVLAERRDEDPGVAALDLEEQGRAAGLQVLPDLLDELAVDAGRG